MDTLSTTPSSPPDADKPKQYIRTFHGDIETVKRGGTPDLAPLGAPTPSGRLITPETVHPAPAVIQPAPAPAPTPPTPPAPLVPPAVEPVPVVAPEEPRSSPLETYAGDFSEQVKKMKASTLSVLAAEQDSGTRHAEVHPQKFSRNSIFYSIAGGVLIIAGGVGAYLAYTQYLATSTLVLLPAAAAAPIFVDDRQPVSGTGTALLQAVEQSVTRPLPSGSVRLLYLDTATTTNVSVFSALQLPAPGALLRNINAPQSMAGIVNVDGTQSPFFILSVTSYSDTFAALLQWEPHLLRDLTKLFPPYPAPAATAPIATSTATTSTPRIMVANTVAVPVPVAAFFDATIANHDVRVYRDPFGRDVLLYGYWNQTTLVIARDAAAFTEIIGRLATSRAQ